VPRCDRVSVALARQGRRVTAAHLQVAEARQSPRTTAPCLQIAPVPWRVIPTRCSRGAKH